jgi:two-component system, chemotaxis family, chemotaxis protein CheY
MTFNGKVLIADDEAHIRKFVGLVVKTLGQPTIVEAPDGQAAVEAYEREQPDLVLLDVNMPKMDGLQTLQALKQKDPDCLVIMLTSLVNRQTIEDCLRLGAVGYIRKDTPPKEISAQLAKTIDECFGDEGAEPPTS